MRVMTLICIFCVLLTSTTYANTSDAARIAGDVETLVLTIDGIDPDMTGRGAVGAAKNLLQVLGGNPDGLNTDNITGRGDSYLAGPINKNWDFATEVVSFPWTGDLTQTESDLKNLKMQISGLAELSERRGSAFVIVAHSWGSVLAYRAISELWGEGKLKRGSIRKLVTIGSPISAQNPADKLAAEKYLNWAGVNAVLEPAESWTNFWLDRDNISGPIDELKHNVTLKYLFADPHHAYYKNSSLLNRIGEVVAVDLASFSPAPNSSSGGQVATVASANTMVAQNTSSPAEPVRLTTLRSGPIPFDPNHLRNLQAGLKENLRPVRCLGCALGAVDMSNIDISMVEFSDATLTCSNFSNTNLGEVGQIETRPGAFRRVQGSLLGDFSHATFQGSDLSGMGIRGFAIGVDFSNAKLSGSSLSGTFDGSNFNGADLSGANLKGASLFGASFQAANLSEADLSDATLETHDLNGATLCNTTMPTGEVEYSGCSGKSFVNPDMVTLPDRRSQGSMQPTIWQGYESKGSNYTACDAQRPRTVPEVIKVYYGGMAWNASIMSGDKILRVRRSLAKEITLCENMRPQTLSKIKQAGITCEDAVRKSYSMNVCETPYVYFPSDFEATEAGETVFVDVDRDGQQLTIQVQSGRPTLQEAAAAECPAYVTKLASGRPAPAPKTLSGTYRGASVAPAIWGGQPALEVQSVTPGSDLEQVGVKTGDLLQVLQPQHIRYGDINTAENLRLIEQEEYARNPNNPYAPFNILVIRGNQQFWIEMPRK